MLTTLKSNPVILFLIKATSFLLIWFVVYEFWLNQTGIIDRPLVDNLIFLSSALLRLFGYSVIEHSFSGMRTMGIDGTNGIWIGDPCDGISLFAVFAILIICFPGPWKTKAWFIPIGLLIIHLFNVIRLSTLAIIEKFSPKSLDFNHTYTFQIIVYGLIFLLWIRWIKKYSGLKINNSN